MITSQERQTQLQKLQDQIKGIFKQIENATSIEELKSIENQDQYAYLKDKKFNIPESKYPRLDISLTKEDITSLKEKNFLDKDGVLCKSIATKNDLLTPLSPLEKLLYSILWKNGDLGKEKHIHDGVIGRDDKKNALVFYYFGKHLAEKSNPIIDQHVIRAWKSFKAVNDESQNFEEKLGEKDVTRKDKEVCEDYIDWQNKIKMKIKKDVHIDFAYYVDRLLFALGKYLKYCHRKIYIPNLKKD
jgi:hypothetical protein